MLRYQAALQHLTGLNWRQQYVLRDIHCQNTLFFGDTLSAFIDFDALRIDTPATDLARLLGSVQLELAPSQWQSQRVALWNEVLAAYREICPLSDADEMLTRRLVEISPLLTLANWAIWVVDEPERFSGAMQDAMERMNSWARAVRMGTEFTG
jgi:Ser/Thr protein kinase RdoA (MazF antagonist)